MRTLLTAVCLVALAGCAADCGPDWYGIGQRDGVLGATPQEDYYAGRCKVEVDAVRYREGWRDGYSRRPSIPAW